MTVVLASAACGSDEEPSSDPGPETKSSDTEALLHDADDSTPSSPGSSGDDGFSGADGSGGCQLPDGPRSLAQVKGPPEDLDGACVPSWTQAQLEAGFAEIRDARLLTMPEQPDFPRRLPWLEADNGCEERAQAASYYFDQWGYPTPYYARVVKKPGHADLLLETDNDPAGQVKWSGHVAPVVRVDGQLMVLDPAVEPQRPLPIADWLARFSVAGHIDVALCRDHALGEGCFDAEPAVPSPPYMQPYGGGMHRRLETEWRVQELLGRDPYRSLGDCPPWATCAEPEPTPDPSSPPAIRRFASDRFDSLVWYPIYVIGDNFVEGLTTVRITGNGIDELAPIDACNLRRILITQEYPSGSYQVTAANGELVSQPVTLTIE